MKDGEYQMHSPILMINDVELARMILVKDFDNFINWHTPSFREAFNTGTETDKIFGYWRRLKK